MWKLYINRKTYGITVASSAVLFFSGLIYDSVYAQRVVDYGGQTPCSVWLSNSKAKREGMAWLFGAWSGLNIAGGLKHDVFDVGHTLEPSEVSAAVEDTCRQDMAKIMNAAILETYVKARASRR